MEKLKVIAKVINCIDFLIMGLSDRTPSLRSAVCNVVEYSIKNNFSEFQNFIIQTNIDEIYKYVYCVPEKRPETKKRYINEVYNLLLITGEFDERYLYFLKLVHKELSVSALILNQD